MRQSRIKYSTPDNARQLFEAMVQADPDLMQVLEAARKLGLPQWRLVAGCLYQTVWNVLTDRPRGTGINDYDLIYFDATDVSFDAEDRVIQRVAGAMPQLPAPVEVRNQARVHLWFEQRFGQPYPPLANADESLTRYASKTHAVGVRLEADGRLDSIAPFGWDDMFNMVIRPNHALDNAETHMRKARRAQAIWPQVTILPW
jgi:uncharacterized protein